MVDVPLSDLEKEFSEIVAKINSSQDATHRVNQFLYNLFMGENSSINISEKEMFDNYMRVAYHLYRSAADNKNTSLDLVLLQLVPICFYIYYESKNMGSKLSSVQQLFLSKIESALLLIFNTETVRRRELPEKEKTLSFLGSSIEGVKTRYNNIEKSNNVLSQSSKDSQSHTSILLGSSHANEDYLSGVANRPLFLRSEMYKNQEALSPLYFKDHEHIIPLSTEISDKVLCVVLQLFCQRAHDLPLHTKLTFLRVIQTLVSQKVPYRVPTMEQVDIIRSRNLEAKKIMEESLSIIKQENSTAGEKSQEAINESDIQIEVGGSEKKKKMYYHEYLSQLDLITLYSEHYGDVAETNDIPLASLEAKSNQTLGSRRINISEPVLNDAIALLKHCSQNMEQTTSFQDLFTPSKTATKTIVVEALYAVYLRTMYDFIDSTSLVQVQAILKLLD